MNHVHRSQIDPAHRRVPDGVDCGDFAFCETCRWRFKRRPANNSIQRCADCWLEEAEAFAAVLHAVGVRRRLWDECYSRVDRTPPPDHEERLALYAARAERGEPLFAEG